MATQKKYHDLVILDENSNAQEIGFKKFILGGLLFISGILVGAIFVTLLNNHNINQSITDSEITTITQPNPVTQTADEEPQLQSITGAGTSNDEAGCGITSLQENPEGCSADAFTEETPNAEQAPTSTSLDSLNLNSGSVNDGESTRITDLNQLDAISIDTETSNQQEKLFLENDKAVTNILDLQ